MLWKIHIMRCDLLLPWVINCLKWNNLKPFVLDRFYGGSEHGIQENLWHHNIQSIVCSTFFYGNIFFIVCRKFWKKFM